MCVEENRKDGSVCMCVEENKKDGSVCMCVEEKDRTGVCVCVCRRER
jgi:hypothetical protein